MSSKTNFLINYLNELEDCLKEINEKIIILESKNDNIEVIESIFRTLHTIKGNSALFNLNRLKSVAHYLEELLELASTRKIQVDEDFIKIVWEGARIIGQNIHDIKSGNRINELNETEENLTRIINDYITNSKKERFIKKTNSAFRYKYQDADITEYILEIEKYILTAEKQAPLYEETENFINALDNISDLFLSRNNKDLSAHALKIKDNLQSFQEDDGNITPFLMRLIRETYNSIIKDIVKVDRLAENTYRDTDYPSNPNTFRVEENKIDDILSTVIELNKIETGFIFAVTQLSQHNVPDQIVSALQSNLICFRSLGEKLTRKIMDLKFSTLDNLFEKTKQHVFSLAYSCKKEIQIITCGNDILVDRANLEFLEQILIHIVRNCVDHGIETPRERIKNGKPALGTIHLEATETKYEFTLKISDDGQGIDFEALRKIALEKGILTQDNQDSSNKEDLIGIMFMKGISTSKKLSDLSGRGIGLNIVLRNLSKMGGCFDIDSQNGKGTSFILRLPKKFSSGNSL